MYHDDQLAAQAQRDALTHALQGSPAPEQLARVFGDRVARVCAGLVGLFGFAYLVLDVLTNDAAFSGHILLGSWVLALAVLVPAQLLASRGFRAWLEHQLRPGDDPFADVERLADGRIWQTARAEVDRLEAAALALPLAAISLLAPLSLHLIYWALFCPGATITDFSRWVVISLVLVGHAHVTLVIASVAFVRRLTRAEHRGRHVHGGRSGVSALLVTGAVALLPGALLIFVPPLLVLLTGLAFVPLIFHWAARQARCERRVLEQAVAAPPPEAPQARIVLF